jgi:hypothetical protein
MREFAISRSMSRVLLMLGGKEPLQNGKHSIANNPSCQLEHNASAVHQMG